MKFIQSHLSKTAILIIVVITGWYGKNLDTWGKNKVISNDVISYYAYLPAAIIFHDLNFEFTKDLPEDFEGTIWLQTAPGGKPILRMTMGLAIVWMPFFLLAHGVAHLIGVSTLGYSWPYSFSIFAAALFYLFLGLFFLRKILLRSFSEFTTATVLILIVFATNLIYYVISEPGMSHVSNFAMITIFLYVTFRWIDNPGILNTLMLGLLAGIIVLIRPVNILVLLFPALLGIKNIHDLALRFKKFLKWILIAGIAAFLVVLPQLLYWKSQTGHFFFNSYMDQGRFFFLEPHIINGLFSFRKGWLIYTPVMILAIAGFLWLKKYVPGILLPALLFVMINIWVVFSWWCWWYGGSFGSRPMIDMYGIMAIPLAATIEKIRMKKSPAKIALAFLLIGFIWLNQFQMSQYRTSLLHWDSMTKKAYVAIFGKKNWPENYDKMIHVPDYDKALKGEKEYPQP